MRVIGRLGYLYVRDIPSDCTAVHGPTAGEWAGNNASSWRRMDVRWSESSRLGVINQPKRRANLRDNCMFFDFPETGDGSAR